MRKRWGNFLQKAMAVMLSAVLCMGLVVGAEPMEAWAAETQTAWLHVTFTDYAGIPTGMINVYLRDDDYVYYDLSVSGQTGSVTYKAEGLLRNKRYYWIIDGKTTATFESDLAGYTIDRKFYPVYFKDGSTVLFTRYVASGEKTDRPTYKPVKQDFTFMGWRSSYGGNTEFPFSTQRITESTDIYASWRRTVTDAALSTWLQYAIDRITVTNSTTQDYVKNYVKGQIDQIFDIKSTVTVIAFEPAYATSESAGSLGLEVSVEYGEFSASSDVVKTIPMLPTIQNKGWMIDSTGKLIIASRAGMNDWAGNGIRDNAEIVKEVQIQDGVTSIPAGAFSGCGNLASVTISNSVTGIGDGAFSGCSDLGKVVMQGTTPPTMGNSVFEQCKFATDPDNTEGIVVPPGSADEYKNAGGVFAEYDIKEEGPELTQEALDRKLQEILDNLPVSNDTAMNDAISEVKKAIDEYFQIDCTIQPGMFGIEKATSEKDGQIVLEMTVLSDDISVKKQVTKPIPRLPEQNRGWTLDENGNLTVTSPEGMDDWVQNGRTEENLSAVKNIQMQDGITEIPDKAFSGCGNLENVSIPGSVAVIGDGAFSGCSALDRVVMQGTEPPAMGASVFDRCKFVEDNTEGIVVPVGSEDKYKDAWGDALGEHISEKLPTVTGEALDSKLQEVFDGLIVSNDTTEADIVDKIKKALGDYFRIDFTVQIAAFDREEATGEAEGALSLAVTARYGTVLSTHQGTIPIAKLSPEPDRGWTLDEAGNLTIRSQVGMDDWAQTGKGEAGASSVRKAFIQGDVTAIPDNAFSSCNNMDEVAIPETVTDIGSSAFAFTSSLSSITLPQGLRRIGNEAFLGCDSLEKVVMRGSTPPSMGQSVFDNCRFVTDSIGGISCSR